MQMDVMLDWLLSPENPPVRYQTAANLLEPGPTPSELSGLRRDALQWRPLRTILDLQLVDGSFPKNQKTPTAQPTFTALCLMERCGLDITDGPVANTVSFLEREHLGKGALSYTTGGSGILPCYAGVVSTALIKMGALDTRVVQSSIDWLIKYQRFDHKERRAGGGGAWPYKAPKNYGCWDSVSCYHGVAGALRAFAAIPKEARSADVNLRLADALEYMRIHRLYKKSAEDRPLFRHLTQFFLVGDYRSDLLDMLQGIADADPMLISQDWVREPVDDMRARLESGLVPLVKNYGKKLINPIPFETEGEPSRFLTYQWLMIERAFASAKAS